jgi:hypothetical protein
MWNWTPSFGPFGLQHPAQEVLTTPEEDARRQPIRARFLTLKAHSEKAASGGYLTPLSLEEIYAAISYLSSAPSEMRIDESLLEDILCNYIDNCLTQDIILTSKHQGNTLLHYAAKHNQPSVAAALLKKIGVPISKLIKLQQDMTREIQHYS